MEFPNLTPPNIINKLNEKGAFGRVGCNFIQTVQQSKPRLMQGVLIIL